jgi:predicted dinucleotide-binding enzyme
MKSATIGSGMIRTALARTFARKNIEVAIANSRPRPPLRPAASLRVPEYGGIHFAARSQDRSWRIVSSLADRSS